MKKVPVVAIFFTLAGGAFAQNLTMVNAASLSPGSVAPGAIATIKGNNLTTKVAVATDAQNPPTTLGNVTVAFGSTKVALFYVSPSQINLVIPTSLASGSQAFTVTSADGTTQNGTVTIDPNAAPGLFSLEGTGTRDGAILNAINFGLGDFSPRIGGSQTYLALFATGLNLTVAPTVTIGGVNAAVAGYAAAPCCEGLEQVNVTIPPSLAGAGRVPVVLTSGGKTSNTVQVVMLPLKGQGPFAKDEDQGKRSRELASIAYIPNTTSVLSADENDDVVRVIDIVQKKVTQVITLPQGSGPSAVAVNAAGTIAVVTEKDAGEAAILDLTHFTVLAQVSTGHGPLGVGIGNTVAVVTNDDDDTVSFLDLTKNAVIGKPLPVGHGPEAVAVDAAANLAYVVNENDGSVSVIDLTKFAVSNTWVLDPNLRPESIALIPGAVAYLTVPGEGPDGQVQVLDLTTGKVTKTLSANPENSGGSSAVVLDSTDVYFANQAGQSVSVLPIDAKGNPTGPITSIPVDLGARALAIVPEKTGNVLVVSNEGTGTLVLIDLTTNTVTGRINAVQTSLQGDTEQDDHSDRGAAANLPSIHSLTPASGKAGAAAFTLTIAGTNLTGATSVVFINPANLPGSSAHDRGGNGGDNGNSPFGQPDTAFTVSNVTAAADGSQVTATVTIAASATAGPRMVQVKTPGGETSLALTTADTFTVQ